MKKLILSTLVLGLANLFAQPVFKFASESYDFGEVPEGPQAIYSFEFTNVGNEPLVISHAQASCGCTVPEWSKDTIKPGGKGFVKAIYNTAGRMGQFNKNITITYNNTAEPSKTLFIRGLKPIAEIQYLDYIYYTIQTLADDVSCLHYRTKGGQICPLIIRTRGHRLEGVWHSGSPIAMIINAVRGMYVLVPRNMTQASGMYNTMLKSDDAAIIIECLSGYRLKERLPNNIGTFTIPLGIPETLRKGTDMTIVTYGTMCKIVMEACAQLDEFGISCEVIDIQTILPFDIHHSIVESVKRTNRVIFADEDTPGGATAYMMQQVLEVQEGFDIYRVKGWDYQECLDVYLKATDIARKEHVPSIIHVLEITQPQGHSTSGSHERYKSKERLAWEKEYDCNRKMREWILDNDFSTEAELLTLEKETKEIVIQGRNKAWAEYQAWLKEDREKAIFFFDLAKEESSQKEKLAEVRAELEKAVFPTRCDDVKAVRKALRYMTHEDHEAKKGLLKWLERVLAQSHERYNSKLYCETENSALNIKEIRPEYDESSPLMDGREILGACFDAALKNDKRVIAFGEDVSNGDIFIELTHSSCGIIDGLYKTFTAWLDCIF